MQTGVATGLSWWFRLSQAPVSCSSSPATPVDDNGLGRCLCVWRPNPADRSDRLRVEPSVATRQICRSVSLVRHHTGGMADSLSDLAMRIGRACRADPALIAIDGRGGAGKSTLARKLALRLDGAAIVPTDDFAAWHDPLEWWPRMLVEVIEPLSNGRPARYQRREFSTGALL